MSQAWSLKSQGDHSFSTMIFHALFHDQKMYFHDLLAQHIFLKWTIHDLWMLNRIKIFPVARRNYCHKIKPQVYVHIFTSISMLQNSLSNITLLTALEILQLLLHFPWLSMTLAVFHNFPGLENGLTKFHDFPGRVVTLKSKICNALPNTHDKQKSLLWKK